MTLRRRTGAITIASAVIACAGGIVASSVPAGAGDPTAVHVAIAPEGVPATALVGRGGEQALAQTLPPSWAISVDLSLSRDSQVQVGFGGRAGELELRSRGGRLAVRGAYGGWRQWPDDPSWQRDGWHHLEATPYAVTIDGQSVPMRRSAGRRMQLRAARGRVRVAGLLITRDDQPGALLLQRLAELHARTAPGRFPIATYGRDRPLFADGWTSGFWAAALWQAQRLSAGRGPFAAWALQATLAHMGKERTPTHDVGFMYAGSSLQAYRSLCPNGAAAATCGRLRQSALTAANTLMYLASTNAAAGTIPMTPTGPVADTIIDSVMNLSLLTWASTETGNPAFAAVARRHAERLSQLLVRPNGATIQSVHFRRSDGAVLLRHTHQGLSNLSVWARGQAWAVYGFAQIGRDLRDPALVRVSERAARYIAATLPADGVPPYDYAAGPGAPRDVSAGVITAAGLFQLDSACRALPGTCAEPGRWTRLGSRMLNAALAGASRLPPLGVLGSQVYNERGRALWMRDAELIFGLDYALEALGDRMSMSGSRVGTPPG